MTEGCGVFVHVHAVETLERALQDSREYNQFQRGVFEKKLEATKKRDEHRQNNIRGLEKKNSLLKIQNEELTKRLNEELARAKALEAELEKTKKEKSIIQDKYLHLKQNVRTGLELCRISHLLV
jgi:regulator of replication initiation timing